MFPSYPQQQSVHLLLGQVMEPEGPLKVRTETDESKPYIKLHLISFSHLRFTPPNGLFPSALHMQQFRLTTLFA